jgi:hypothetical protein
VSAVSGLCRGRLPWPPGTPGGGPPDPCGTWPELPVGPLELLLVAAPATAEAPTATAARAATVAPNLPILLNILPLLVGSVHPEETR